MVMKHRVRGGFDGAGMVVLENAQWVRLTFQDRRGLLGFHCCTALR